jgi:hypothetical protein
VPVGWLVGVALVVGVGELAGGVAVAVADCGVGEGGGCVAVAVAGMVPVGVTGPERSAEGSAGAAVVAVGSAADVGCAADAGVPTVPDVRSPFTPDGGTVVGGDAGSVAVGAGGVAVVLLAATAGAAHSIPMSRKHPAHRRATDRRIRPDGLERRVSPHPM